MADGAGDHTERLNAAELKRRRIAAHLSRPQLANRAGVTRAFIWQIETGKSGASVPKIGAIADVLGCDITDLMAGSAPGNGESAA